MPLRPSRAVILFSRAPREEEARKHLASGQAGTARGLLAAAQARLAREVRQELPDVTMLRAGGPAVAGPGRGRELRLEQRGATFAERLSGAFEDAQALGFREIVLVGGDVPGLSARHLADAFLELAQGKLVLGPCPDGGVYLIGTSCPVAPVLGGVRWMTSHVVEDLREAAAGGGLALHWLEALRDVDDRLDLARLLADPGTDDVLRAMVREVLAPRRNASGGPERCPSTAPEVVAVPRGPPAAALAVA